MKFFTFFIVLVLSVSVYAKTEATVTAPGIKSGIIPALKNRTIAASTNEITVAIESLSDFNNAPYAKVPKPYNVSSGFQDMSGALTLKSKKTPLRPIPK